MRFCHPIGRSLIPFLKKIKNINQTGINIFLSFLSVCLYLSFEKKNANLLKQGPQSKVDVFDIPIEALLIWWPSVAMFAFMVCNC